MRGSTEKWDQFSEEWFTWFEGQGLDNELLVLEPEPSEPNVEPYSGSDHKAYIQGVREALAELS